MTHSFTESRARTVRRSLQAKQASKFEMPWRLRSRASRRRPSELDVGAAHPSRARRDRACSRVAALVRPAPSPPPSPPLSLSPCAAERSGGGSAEKRDRSCGAGWGCAARRGRSDHGCSHRGWLGIHRGCSRRGQAAAVAIAEVCMPSLCPCHSIACHSSAQARMPLGARVGGVACFSPVGVVGAAARRPAPPRR